jgi:hypothetical protein
MDRVEPLLPTSAAATAIFAGSPPPQLGPKFRAGELSHCAVWVVGTRCLVWPLIKELCAAVSPCR